ncbi:GNAT family N-acetyltransferase [Chitinimonas lacunae]|uniref:GNAT family N-acetyltransferase n=1 Tax=Chitinimonas lacunae TaxID=1963018 RepID=A0ABV8MP29_9NEIS
MSSSSLTVEPLLQTEQGLFRQLYALYLHDLSEFSDFYQLDATGHWTPDYLPTWLAPADPRVRPFLFRLDGKPLGFALVGARPFPYRSVEADYRLSEFFVLRQHRRGGWGRLAAQCLFDRLPGCWEMVQLARNKPAIAFWQRVIADYTGGDYQNLLIEGEMGQRFRCAGHKAGAAPSLAG